VLLLEHIPDMLTISTAAEALKTTPDAMMKLISSGLIDHVEIDDNIIIPKVLLDDFIEKGRQACYNGSVTANGPFPLGTANTHLDNCIGSDTVPSSEGDTEMAKKFNQSVTINGVKHWITANSVQEFTDKVMALQAAPSENQKHLFEAYAMNWFVTYSAPNIETVTDITYKRQLNKHILPAFSGRYIEDITTDDVQRLFNGMGGAKATKDKVRVVLNQILDSAVEDKLLASNPLKSKRLKITGTDSIPTPPYTVEQMRYLVSHISDVERPLDRAWLALAILHPLRPEETLGLKGDDVDVPSATITVRRAVTHPDRNQPEVKETKTSDSVRRLSLSSLAVPYLPAVSGDEYILGGKKPLTYTQVRKICERIQRDTGFNEKVTPQRFRTTVLTDIYDKTKDIKLTQAAAGHTTPAMTLKHYVKGRETSAKATAAVEQAYSA